jgi:hypothetical protein
VQRRTLTDEIRSTAFWSLTGLGVIGTVALLLGPDRWRDSSGSPRWNRSSAS